MKNHEILEQAWQLLQQPGAWTKGHYARTASGEGVHPTSEEAVSFCSLGAIERARLNLGLSADGDSYPELVHINRVAYAKTGSGIVTLNDKVSTVQDLAPIWQEAIETA